MPQTMTHQAHQTRTPTTPKAEHNREAIDRALLLLESWLNDAFSKHEFYGKVSLEVDFNGGRIITMAPTIRQTVRA